MLNNKRVVKYGRPVNFGTIKKVWNHKETWKIIILFFITFQKEVI